MLAQTAYSADRNNPFDAKAFERPDIGAHGNLCGGNTVPPPMARQEGHRYTLNLAYRNHIAGISKGRLYRDLFNISHPLHAVEAASTNHTNRRLWHETFSLMYVITNDVRVPLTDARTQTSTRQRAGASQWRP